MYKYGEEDISIQNKYEDALRKILSVSRLQDLSTIEKVSLRNIVEDATSRYKQITIADNEFPISSEAACIFLMEYYECRFQNQNDALFLEKIWKGTKEKNYDAYALFFQKKQDESHLI